MDFKQGPEEEEEMESVDPGLENFLSAWKNSLLWRAVTSWGWELLHEAVC